MQLIINNNTKMNSSFLEPVFRVCIEFLSLKKEFQKFTNHKKLEINLHFIDDSMMKSLNNKWRGINNTTDVLSFPYYKLDEEIINQEIHCFGEIFVSIERCKIQAKSQSHSLKREITIMFIHGILHLFGYDHIDKEDYKVMQKAEKIIIEKLDSQKGQLKKEK